MRQPGPRRDIPHFIPPQANILTLPVGSYFWHAEVVSDFSQSKFSFRDRLVTGGEAKFLFSHEEVHHG